ncbi:MAG: glycosyltransferase [Bacteroidota bacterium]
MSDDRLRVAFFVDNFYPQFNGVLTSYMNTVNELARRGHEILVVAPKIASRRRYDPASFPYPLLYKRGIPAFFYPDFRLTWPISLSSVVQTRQFGADIIHFHSPLTIAMQGIFTARALRVPLVGTFHTFFAEPEYLKVVGLEEWHWLVKAGWWYNNLLYDACDAVISPAKWTAADLKAHDAKAEIVVIPNGVEFSRYAGLDAGSIQPPVELPDDAELVIYVGRVSREKSIDVVIRAMAHVFPRRPQAHLVIVGDGPARRELTDLVRASRLEEKVTFTGMIKNDVLLGSGLLGRAKVFATASTSENQPMTILEAMIFGLPIVGVDARGVPEMIQGNGFVCPPENPEAMGESILRLLTDEEQRGKMSLVSKRLAMEYSIERTTDRVIELYRRLIEKRRSNRREA